VRISLGPEQTSSISELKLFIKPAPPRKIPVYTVAFPLVASAALLMYPAMFS